MMVAAGDGGNDGGRDGDSDDGSDGGSDGGTCTCNRLPILVSIPTSPPPT